MELRGLTLRDDIVDFTLEDNPVVIAEDKIALLGRENSPFLKKNSICRGFDGVYEGDRVYSKETDRLLGYLVLLQGLCIQKEDNTTERLEDASHIYMKTGNAETIKKVSTVSERAKLLFSYNQQILDLTNFKSKYKGKYLVNTAGTSVKPNEVCAYTGYHSPISGRYLFLGEVLDGNPITVNKGIFYVGEKQKLLLSEYMKRFEAVTHETKR